MIRITEADLRAYLNRREYRDWIDALIDVAEGTLVEFLGQAWVENNVRSARAGNFFRITDERHGDAYRHHHRYLSLAECLFNLQNRKGFAGRLELLQRNDVETAVAEMELGRFLAGCGLPFEFRDPSGMTGEDYDIDAVLPEGSRLPAEGKAKVEGTAYSQQTIRNSLEDARKQLPKGRAGLVFVKFPEEWFLSNEGMEALETALASFLRNTTRVAAVVLLWERWAFSAEGARVASKYDVRLNPRTSVPGCDLTSVLRPTDPIEGWFDYRTLSQ